MILILFLCTLAIGLLVQWHVKRAELRGDAVVTANIAAAAEWIMSRIAATARKAPLAPTL